MQQIDNCISTVAAAKCHLSQAQHLHENFRPQKEQLWSSRFVRSCLTSNSSLDKYEQLWGFLTFGVVLECEEQEQRH